MKNLTQHIIACILGLLTLGMGACSGDSENITIQQDGSNNRNAIVSFLGPTSFYIDYIQYSIVGSHLEVVGHDEIEYITYAKPYARVTIDGTTYETRAIRGWSNERIFSDCTLVNYFSPFPQSLEKIDIPATVTEIDEGAFANLAIRSIIIPEGVVAIGDGVFSGCQNLDSISLPSTLRIIGHHAFTNCKSLESISLPEALTEICWKPLRINSTLENIFDTFTSGAGLATFSGCSSLKRVNCYAVEPPRGHLLGASSDVQLHVPASSLQAYQDAWGSRFNNIIGDL